MKLLKLEQIGGGNRDASRSASCKEVVALSAGGYLVTRAMKPNRDYTHSNGVGTRGVYDYFILSPGKIYEVTEPLSWKRSDHYFLALTDKQEMVRMNYEEVIECLSGGSVSMC